MPSTSFTFIATNPWRMLLFGVLGCLLPLAAYVITWEWLEGMLDEKYQEVSDWMLIPILLVSGIFTFFGFRYSSVYLTVDIDERGMLKKMKPRLFFLPRREVFIAWKELHDYTFTEDSRGKVLGIHLKDKRSWTISQAYVIDRSIDFDLFYQSFLQHLNDFNFQPGQKDQIAMGPDFYRSKWGKILAYLLLFLMVVVAILPIIRGEPMSGWQWFRLCFFEIAGGVYVYRSLIAKR
ncbi:MAG: hypothetical protein IPH04_10950 [Saprospirales bacterium]|nr:hypothetical protein [Saprospirales bacterium]